MSVDVNESGSSTYAPLHMYVNSYVCMFVCMYVCMYVLYVCMYACMYVILVPWLLNGYGYCTIRGVITDVLPRAKYIDLPSGGFF